MKRISFIILFLILSQFLLARKDSTKLVNFRGFYINSYYPYGLFSHYNVTDKYSSDYLSKFELKDYQGQLPGIGVGYVLSGNALFIKTDFNYLYGTKALDDNFRFNSDDKNGKDPYTKGSISYQYPSAGYRYYRINDYYTGIIKLHFFDIGFAVTGNITRFLRLYCGWRFSRLMKYSYNAKIERTASLYEVKRYNSQIDRVDSLIETEYLEYKNKAAENQSVQRMQSHLFLNFGLNANFRIKNQLFLVDLLYESSQIEFNQEGVIKEFITFKLAYVFKYSTYLGKKKVKD